MSDKIVGVTFAPDDMELLKRALYCYKDMLTRIEESESITSTELINVANLMHRIGRIT